MTTQNTTPTDANETIAEAVLTKGRDCWLWVVPTCPLCGGKHTHGGGSYQDDPREMLGHRIAHCGTGGDYHLVERSNGQTTEEAHQACHPSSPCHNQSTRSFK